MPYGSSDPSIVEVRRRSLDVSWRTTWDFVEVVTADGAIGLGEWSDAGPWQLTRPYFDAQASRLLGLPLESALVRVEAAIGRTGRLDPRSVPRRQLELTVLGGIDAALCDLAARSEGVDLAAWLAQGGTSDMGDTGAVGSADVRCYANLNRAVHVRAVDRVEQITKAAVDAGFTRLKFAPFDFLVGAGRIAAGLELAAAVRDTAGAEAELMLDLHHQLSVDELLAIRERLRALDPRWLEDVAPLADVEAHRRIREELGIPVAAGEFAASGRELRPLLEAGAVDVVLPDVKHGGGPRRALALSRFVAGHGVEVSPHNPTGPVSSAHTASLCRALPSYGLLELAVLETEGRAAIVDPPEQTVAGDYVSTSGSGLGVRLAARATWSDVREFR